MKYQHDHYMSELYSASVRGWLWTIAMGIGAAAIPYALYLIKFGGAR